MTQAIPFQNSYARLPDRFFTRMSAKPVEKPGLVAINADLAHQLGLDADWLNSEDGLAMLAGNHVPAGAEPLAQVYAGHQFGGWSPQLGDGRALLLGELRDTQGNLRDIQLKGSGPTPYSRMGDGRAWLGPVMREYIVSEAMHALGVPTTRALAAVTTGEIVLREAPLPGAVLTRVAASHLRVGTFQYFAARQDKEALATLCEFAIKRHYPEAKTALDLLNSVIAAQAKLIAKWMGLGFIHGVMNTDNMTISGETIDYGPCAFMEIYHPETVYSSIDQYGRYAYGNQPEIAVWNLAQLATALLPLIDADQNTGIELATEAVHAFPDLYAKAYGTEFAAKLALDPGAADTAGLVQEFLGLITGHADFTLAFRGLASGQTRDLFKDPNAYDAWTERWTKSRLADWETALPRANPGFIPRNHQIEAAIQSGVQGDYSHFNRLNSVLRTPFKDQPEHADLQVPATMENAIRQTFCGT